MIYRYEQFIREFFEPNYAQLGKLQELKDKLEKHNIPTDDWGTGKSKTLYHLFLETEEGETILEPYEYTLIRKVSFIGGIILYKKDGEWLRLKEDKQVFVDGRTRVRKKMPYSLAEKFKTGEDHKNVVIRGAKEELDLTIDESQISYYNERVFIEESSQDYPGLKTEHTGYEYLIILNEDQYKPEGYIEKQADKSVYFGWHKMYKK
jgi:hypothetical protein